jgi:hypothetical protein
MPHPGAQGPLAGDRGAAGGALQQVQAPAVRLVGVQLAVDEGAEPDPVEVAVEREDHSAPSTAGREAAVGGGCRWASAWRRRARARWMRERTVPSLIPRASPTSS